MNAGWSADDGLLRPSARAFGAHWNVDSSNAGKLSPNSERARATAEFAKENQVISFSGAGRAGLLRETLIRSTVPSVTTEQKPLGPPANHSGLSRTTVFLRTVAESAMDDYSVVYDWLKCKTRTEVDMKSYNWTKQENTRTLSIRCRNQRHHMDDLEKAAFGQVGDRNLMYLIATLKAEAFLATTMLADLVEESKLADLERKGIMSHDIEYHSNSSNVATGFVELGFGPTLDRQVTPTAAAAAAAAAAATHLHTPAHTCTQ